MAKKTAKEFGAEGGRKRAAKLSGAERSRIAREAAVTRWQTAGKDIRRVEFEGDLHIGDTRLWCAVLEDGTRVFSRREFIAAIRRGTVKGGSKFERETEDKFHLPVFLSARNLNPFISKELIVNSTPIHYTSHGGPGWGIRAEVLPELCQVYMDAKEAGALQKSQLHIAEKCRILQRGFAKVGIFALIDEATGAQDTRSRDALAKILQAFIAKELRRWVRAFPMEFFKGLCRLRRVPFNEAYQFPSYFGHLINDLIYARLAPFVLEELRNKNPVNPETGRRKSKLFQWLSDDIGDPKLRAHLIRVVTLMDATDDWATFYRLLDKVCPKYSTLPLLALAEEELPAGALPAPRR